MEYIYAALVGIVAGGLIFALVSHLWAPLTPPTKPRILPKQHHSKHTRIIGTLTRITNSVLPQSKTDAESMRARLMRAGLSMSPTSYHSLRVVLCALASLLVLLVVSLVRPSFSLSLLLGLGVLGVLLVAPRLVLVVLARKRADEIRSTLPKALDLLESSVKAGLTMERAMHLYAREEKGALSHEFSIADQEMNTLGFSRSDALVRMAKRCGVDEVSLFVGALNTSAASGSPLADVLHAQSDAAFERRRQYFEEQGNKLTSKMILPMGLFLVPAVLIAAIAPLVINIASTTSGVL